MESPDYKNKEYVLDILGHVNIGVTQNVYGRSSWEERVDAATELRGRNSSCEYFGIVANGPCFRK